MKTRQAHLLFICALVLLANIQSVAQQNPSAVVEEKRAAARVEAQEKRAAVEEKRAAARVEAQKHRTLARVELDRKRALAQEKRAAAHAISIKKRVEARAAVDARRALATTVGRLVPADGTFRLLGSRPNLDTATVVKGSPYSATAVTEHTHTLSDGNKIIKKNEATCHRDSEGRVRIDQKLKTIGKWNAAGDAPSIITIWDPVAGRYYSLDPRTRTAVTNFRRPRVSNEKSSTSRQAHDKAAEAKAKSAEAAKTETRVVSQESSGRRRTKESLGKQVIQGVAAEGTRSTLTIPAGEVGNLLPIDVVDESWYSPELQVKVMTRHHDPRSGETVYRLTNVSRSEPARSLFEVPADYRIIDRSTPRVPTKPELPKLPGTPPTPQKNL